MSHLLVNGIELSLPLAPETSFQDLIHFLRRNLTSETALISSVKVDGNEIDISEEESLSGKPWSELASVEIRTRHPKEIAHDALLDALDFAKHLSSYSLKTSEAVGKSHFYAYMTRLLDGISHLLEAISHVKKILKISEFSVTDQLEVELILVLKELLQYQQQDKKDNIIEILAIQLPLNLENWNRVGIPALIRSRDC